MRMMWRVPGRLCVVLAVAALGVQRGAAADRFTFATIGCMPYARVPGVMEEFARLTAEIARRDPVFTVHCGDIWGREEVPDDAAYARVRGRFAAWPGALIYTPGDNDWTDTHGVASVPAWDPLERLAHLRRTFFAEERSLGRVPLELVSQRRNPEFPEFVENVRWTRGGVVFATLHTVGSNNNFQPAVVGAMAEAKRREAANLAWLAQVFAEARASAAAGVALFFHAQMFTSVYVTGPVQDERRSGYAAVLAALEREARLFAKPVLLLHADEHHFRYEPRKRFHPEGAEVANVTEVGVFGDTTIHGVLVLVDTGSPRVFLPAPLLVPGNPLPGWVARP